MLQLEAVADARVVVVEFELLQRNVFMTKQGGGAEPGILYGANDDRRPAGAAIGY